jgi:hypothetical protein
LPKRDLSYYCADELSECIADCRQTAGEHLRSEVLAKASVAILHEEIFSNFTAARCACILYGNKTDAARVEGVNIFLKYSTRPESTNVIVYPMKEELILGNVCCDDFKSPYFNIPLMPFNRCKPFGMDDIPDIWDECKN